MASKFQIHAISLIAGFLLIPSIPSITIADVKDRVLILEETVKKQDKEIVEHGKLIRRLEYRTKDIDGDGDHVTPSHGDCADDDPTVSPKMDEICDNGKDDDCDTFVDETDDCVLAQ